MIEGWDVAHCLAFLEAPHFDVKHLEIGQETKKLGPLPQPMDPNSHEFDPGVQRQSWRQKTNEKRSFLNDREV